MGRPTIRTPDVVQMVLDRVENGEIAAHVCREAGMPSWSAFKRWMQDDPELRAAYAHARDCGVEQNEAEMLAEARRQPVDSVDAQKQRTLVDTLKWRLQRRLRDEFGDRQHVEHSGTIADGLTEEQRTQRIAEILRTAKARKGSSTQPHDVDGAAKKMPKNPKP